MWPSVAWNETSALQQRYKTFQNRKRGLWHLSRATELIKIAICNPTHWKLTRMSEVTIPFTEVVVQSLTTKYYQFTDNFPKCFAIFVNILWQHGWSDAHASETRVADRIINFAASKLLAVLSRTSGDFNGTPSRCSILHRHVNLEAELSICHLSWQVPPEQCIPSGKSVLAAPKANIKHVTEATK